MRRIALGALVVGLVLVGLIYLIGVSLPVSHVASVRAEYSAPAERAFELIADYRGHPDWRASVERIEPVELGAGRVAWREVSRTGPIPMERTELEAPRRMVTTMLDEGQPFGGRWIYEVESVGEGSRVTITEEGEVYSPIFRFVSRFIMGHHGTASAFLADLGRALGDGDVEIQVVR